MYISIKESAMTDNLELLTKPRMNNKPGKPGGLFALLGIQKMTVIDVNDPRAPGIDISNYQTGINWSLVGQANLAYMFIKSTESNYYISPSFRAQWDNSGALGIPHSAYHFWRGNVDGHVQAAYFLQNSSKGELPPVIDVEDAYNVPQTLTTAQKLYYSTNIRYFLDDVYTAYSQVPIIYTGAWFWNRLGLLSWAQNYPGWFATYRPLDLIGPILPIGWTNWTFWQHSSNSNVSGFPYFVDADVFNGSRTEFMNWAGITSHLTDHDRIMILCAAHPALFPNG
jgi:lysozyme